MQPEPPERDPTAHTSQALAAALIDSSPDGLLLVDRNGDITMANPAAAQIFGRTQDELLGTTVESLVPAEQRARHVEHRERYIESPTTRPMGSGLRLLAEHADGTLFPVEISLSPVDLGEVRFIATVRDVSERQEARARVALHEDRERIARDLHDFVIQHLFAAGMSLSAIAQQVTPRSTADQLEGITDQLDDAIAEIRRTIYRLGQDEANEITSTRIMQIVDDHAVRLGFAPTLDITGDVDSIATDVGEHLSATLTEALSNVVRHAHASTVDVGVRADGRTLDLEVTDDGVGVDGAVKPLGGLANMTWRAEQLGGGCTIRRAESAGGTVLIWSVPLREPARPRRGQPS
ncbi:sensor histidine kinase [Ilumatobacter nonamiensis]|uniref:sensor histidine kinase n=1 Tax=Ilumatobacter nonamiensis TaxID=467093 RepID=UPI0003457DB2|nr:PAS domain S-box protein [Ilumatobacter nonamiensis]